MKETGRGEGPHPQGRAAGSRGRAGRRYRPRLRGQAAGAGLRPQGSHLLHGRPRPPAGLRPGAGVHGGVQLRGIHGEFGGGEDPQGPRHRHRGAARAHSRGHHRLGPHPAVPHQEPVVAQSGQRGDRHAPQQAEPPDGRSALQVHRDSRSPTSSWSATGSDYRKSTAICPS